MSANKKNCWYIGGLHFDCQACGNCCSGPDEGYIWITKPEIKLLADYLKITLEDLHINYLKRVGFRTSIIEHPITNDCIFLQRVGDEKKCTIYSVRPNQCRTWPFWAGNLTNAASWNHAAQRCPGINRGKKYSIEEIQKIKKQKKWWSND